MDRQLWRAVIAFALTATTWAQSMVCPEREQIFFTAVSPLLSGGTISRLDMGWFGVENSASSPVLFTLTAHNRSPLDTTRVRMLVEMIAEPSDPAVSARCADPCFLQREVSLPMMLLPGQTIVRTSRDLLTVEFESGGISALESPFRRLIGRLGHVPAGNLRMRFQLLCDLGGQDEFRDHIFLNVASPSSNDLLQEVVLAETQIRQINRDPQGQELAPSFQPVQEVQALHPGAPVVHGPPPGILTQTPAFVLQSDLLDTSRFRYPADEKRFLVELWEQPPGMDVAEAIDRRAYLQFRTDLGMNPYPADWPPLRPGTRYLWRVSAQLRSPLEDRLESELFTFVVDTRLAEPGSARGSAERVSQADVTLTTLLGRRNFTLQISQEQRRILQALVVILQPRLDEFERFLADGRLPDPASLRHDGRILSIEELEELAETIASGRRVLTGARLP